MGTSFQHLFLDSMDRTLAKKWVKEIHRLTTYSCLQLLKTQILLNINSSFDSIYIMYVCLFESTYIL